MAGLTRFSVSVAEDLLAEFDKQTGREGSPTRSKAIADLMRASLVEQQLKGGKEVAAAIVMVYDHHKRDLANRLTHIQHDYHELIVSSQHVHLDHHNCLEIVVARGQPTRVQELARKLRATKGVQFCNVAAASPGNAD